MSMDAIDTNVLVRLFVVDDPVQAGKARALFDEHADQDGSLWVADTVLVELIWTLERAYGRSRQQLVQVIEALAGHATVALESRSAVEDAVIQFRDGRADFADCLLAAKAKAAGCDRVHTVDKKMLGLPRVQIL